MRLSLRLVVPLLLGVILLSLLFASYQVRREKRLQQKELWRRADLLADSLQEDVEALVARRSPTDLQRLVERFGKREHLAGIAVYDERGNLLAMTSRLSPRVRQTPAILQRVLAAKANVGEFLDWDGAAVHVYAAPIPREAPVAVLMIVQEAAYIEHQGARLWRYLLFAALVQVCLIVLITVLMVRSSILGPVRQTAQWMRALRMGKASPPPRLSGELLTPLTHEAASFAENLATARASAEKEAQLREAGESSWTAERLSVSLRNKLQGSRLFVVANREPCMHTRRAGVIEAIVPASGLVTALEPILCACDGTWVAHGSGDADRETVNERDCLRVPPDSQRYTLRRVWLTKEEEEGYYFGFSNEGLWPLCHIAHTRPIFRAGDWKKYREVNQMFAEAVLDEMAGAQKPVVIVQDYHFALLPRLIKQRRPDARVAIFWHIPWPNPEAFGICPWQRELLDGLLGADLVGFHIQSHCTNFLESVDRALESRIDWEHFSVDRKEHHTVVRPFPISIVWPDSAPASALPVHMQQAALLKQMNLEALFLGVGVDRVDYTKGILERFLGIERFLEKYPEYQGKFTFVQIGAPSRTHIKRYHDLLAEVEAEAERINWRMQHGKWKPIVLLTRHHSHREIDPYYRAADVCLVTSLHDGMNLVAKEFVAARDDEDGALILSTFTGACRELRDALIVNPYDTEQLADTIHAALEMTPYDRMQRMRAMRRVISEHNVYRWAADLIGSLCETDATPRESTSARAKAYVAS
jgi:trehalose-6-phosphate synthase